MDRCKACNNLGWLLAIVDDKDGESYCIQKCDDCRTFDSDNEAVRFVAKIASNGVIDSN